MLRSLKDLERYQVRATDGDLGTVVSFLLDDGRWTVRYLVVKAGGVFTGRQVLISPVSFRQANWFTREFHLALTMDRIKKSPSIDTDLPVSRQLERDHSRYYNYPYYWVSSGVWGAGDDPTSLAVGGWSDQPEQPDAQHRDVHLRSAKELTGYQVHGIDGVIGHVADFLVDDETWEVRYLMVDTAHGWAGGQKVLVSPHWATSISWEKKEVHVDLTRLAIQSSPAWRAVEYLDRGYDASLCAHYGRSVYWDKGASRNGPAGPLPVDRSHSA